MVHRGRPHPPSSSYSARPVRQNRRRPRFEMIAKSRVSGRRANISQFVTAISHDRRGMAERNSRPRNPLDLFGLGKRKASDVLVVHVCSFGLTTQELARRGFENTESHLSIAYVSLCPAMPVPPTSSFLHPFHRVGTIRKLRQRSGKEEPQSSQARACVVHAGRDNGRAGDP